MWELDHKEGWELKNWCFGTVMLVRILENTLDCKEIKPVNLRGNQLWIVTGRTVAEALTLWSPDAKIQLTGKDPHAGEDWRWREKGRQRIRWLDIITDSGDMNLSQLWEWERTEEPGLLQSVGLEGVGHNSVTEQQKTSSCILLSVCESYLNKMLFVCFR